ncbi:expansin-like A3 [Tripterygium wilfordii]|uniref:expansin-like A3 n=1 Tax=Tripterygium wilfordii TaxID=458696 RepID=UPI0018F7F579|nr:expansin-like A3 [Tripterygium wilfordii]
MGLFLCFLFIIISHASACNPCIKLTKASYFSKRSPLSLSYGACDYGPIATNFYGELLAAGSPSLFNHAFGCGACFQIRCKDPVLCSGNAVQVVLTDLHHNKTADLVLSSGAFKAMAKNGKSQQLLKVGIVDVEYSRIPCEYKNHNLSVLVRGFSKRPSYLAITPVYQGGLAEITEIQIQKVNSSKWTSMKKKLGALWGVNIRQHDGPLSFKFTVTVYGSNVTFKAENVLPVHWENGGVYDTGLNLAKVGFKSCPPCTLMY